MLFLILLPAFVLSVGFLVYHGHARHSISLPASEASESAPRPSEPASTTPGLDRAYWKRLVLLLLPAMLVMLVISASIAKFNFEACWAKDSPLFPELIFVLILLPMLLTIPVCLVCLFFRLARWPAMLLLTLGLGYLLFLSFEGFFEHQFRMHALRQFTGHSKPLITAIRAYQNEQGIPPTSLSQLVPRYLPRVPSTGIPARPEYEYFSGENAHNYYPGNPWVLSVTIPTGSLEPRSIKFLPDDAPQRWGNVVDGWSYNGY